MKIGIFLVVFLITFINSLNAIENNISNKDSIIPDSLYKPIYSLCITGNRNRDLGDYFQADLYYQKALILLRSYKTSWPNTEASVLYKIGYNFSCQKNYIKAVEYFKKAEFVYDYRTNNSIGRLYSDMAYVYNCLNENEKAFEYYNKAIKIYEADNIKYSYELSVAYKNLGLIYHTLSENEKAEPLLLKSHNILIECPQATPDHIINSFNYVGYFYFRTHQFKKAISYYQKSFNTVIIEFNDSNIYSNPKSEQLILNNNLLYALQEKARAFYHLFNQTSNIRDLEVSFETYELSFALIDRSRIEFFSEQSNLTNASDFKRTLKYALVTIHKLYKLTNDKKYLNKLFEYSERGKASLLFKSIKDFEAYNIDSNFVKLKILDNKYHSAIALTRNKLESKYNKELSYKFEKFLKLHEKLERFINKHFAHLENITSNTSPIALDSLQIKLKSDEIILEYTITDSLLLCFAIDKDNIELLETKIDSSFINNIRAYKELISTNDNENWEADFNRFVKLSNSIYNILIYPVKDKIKNRRITIIPDDDLLYIPFETLINSTDVDNSYYSNLHYLILDNAISYSYSASLKYRNGTKTSKAKKRLLAFAPDYTRLLSIKDTNNEYLKYKHKLIDIEYAREEAQKVTSLLDGTYMTDNNASEKNFKSSAKKYDIIHLAMHSIINNEDPMLSKFFMSYTADSSEDDCINAYELYNMNLNANMVVLSGCNTGTGKMYGGEGLYNLARGFINSRCSSILLTLWNASDISAKNIIIEFYKNINNSEPKDIALQKAKLDYLSNTNYMDEANPYYWASYIILGNEEALQHKNFFHKNIKTLIILASVFFAISILLFWYRKKR